MKPIRFALTHVFLYLLILNVHAELMAPEKEFGAGFLRQASLIPGSNHFFSVSTNRIFIWDMNSGQQIAVLSDHSDQIITARASQDGSLIYSLAQNGVIHVWNLNTKAKIQTSFLNNSSFRFAKFSPNGDSVIVSEITKQNAQLYEVGSGELLREFAHSGAVVCFDFWEDDSNAPRLLLTGSFDGAAILWNVDSGEQLQVFQAHSGGIASVNIAPDGQRCVTAGFDANFAEWNLEQGIGYFSKSNQTSSVRSVNYSADGGQILTAGDIRITRWSSMTGEKINTLEGHSLGVTVAVSVPNRNEIISYGIDNRIYLWNASEGSIIQTFKGHNPGVYSLAFSPDGSELLTGNGDTVAVIYDIDSEQRKVTLESSDPWERHIDVINSVDFSPSGNKALTGSFDGMVKLWNPVTGELLKTLREETDRVYYFYQARFAHPLNENIVLTASEDQTAKMWNGDSGDILHTFIGHTGSVHTVAYWPETPDEKPAKVITGGADKKIIMWNSVSNEILQTYDGHTGRVLCLTVSSDGEWILSGSLDKTAILWDRANGELIHVFSGHTGQINAVAFSPDNQYILTASGDSTFKIWDAATFELIVSVNAHLDKVQSAIFSPNGEKIATGSFDGTAKIWSVNELTGKTSIRDFMLHD